MKRSYRADRHPSDLLSAVLPDLLSAVLRTAIRGYQLLISPVRPPCCRFLPTCSDYAIEALARHGAWRGTGLALRRLARCHPWGGSGYDPVPERLRPNRPWSGSLADRGLADCRLADRAPADRAPAGSRS